MKRLIITLTALLFAPLITLRAADLPPPGNWDRVPLNIHFAKRTGNLTDAELDFLAKHSVLVTLEKGHGASKHGSTEAGVADTARRLKQRNPSVKVLFYLNAFINGGIRGVQDLSAGVDAAHGGW